MPAQQIKKTKQDITNQDVGLLIINLSLKTRYIKPPRTSSGISDLYKFSKTDLLIVTYDLDNVLIYANLSSFIDVFKHFFSVNYSI
jgi:hypothetical protein